MVPKGGHGSTMGKKGHVRKRWSRDHKHALSVIKSQAPKRLSFSHADRTDQRPASRGGGDTRNVLHCPTAKGTFVAATKVVANGAPGGGITATEGLSLSSAQREGIAQLWCCSQEMGRGTPR